MPGRGAASAVLQRLASQGDLRRQLTTNALGTLLLNLSSRLLILLVSILLARWLGADGYGIYVSAMAVFVLTSVPTTLGLPTLVIRLLASYRVHDEWGLMHGLLRRTNQLVIALSVVIASVGAATIWLLSERLGAEQVQTLWWAMALLPVSAVAALRSAALRGLHHVVLAQLPESLIRPIVFIALLLLWTLLAVRWDWVASADVAMGLRVAATAVALGFAVWALRQRLPAAITNAAPGYDTGYWARSAGPLLFLGGMGVINTQMDVFMLAVLQDTRAAGIYQAASRGALLVTFSLTVINLAIEPSISRLYASADIRRLQRIATLGARIALAVAIPVTLILALFGTPILGTVFGSEFERGALAMTILCIGQVVWAATGSATQILNMTGHEKDAAWGMGIGSITNLSLNAILIPFWGIEGAAIATSLSLATWSLLLVLAVRRRIAVDSSALGLITGLSPEESR